MTDGNMKTDIATAICANIAAVAPIAAAVVQEGALEVVVIIARTRRSARQKAYNATAASQRTRDIILVAAVAAVATHQILVLVVRDWASLQKIMVHASLSRTIRS